MGTIAARDCLRVLQLTEQVASALLIAVRQAMVLRLQQGSISPDQLGDDITGFLAALGEDIAFIDEDRPLEGTLRTLIDRIQARHWPLYAADKVNEAAAS